MTLIFVPAGLRKALVTLGLSIPLSVLYVSFMRQVHWWRLSPKQMGSVGLPVLALVILLGVLVTRYRMLGCWLTLLCGATWTIMSCLATLRLHNSTLGFFSIFLGGAFTGYYFWLKMELGKSFLTPFMKWYQGLPSPLPGLDCELAEGSELKRFRVNRIDREGAFIYSTAPQGLDKLPPTGEWVFVFRSQKIRCHAQVVTELVRGQKKCGYGLQFKGMSADARKVLGDFIETLKGEGYVS